MRRDHFELAVADVDWVDTDGEPEKPHVSIDFHGTEELLREHLTGADDELLAAEETDVAFRLQGDHETDPEATGVVSVTNRLTGDFVLELNEDADDVLRFIRAAREYGRASDGDGRYRVEIDVDGEEVVAYEKETFLVYDADGNLLRRESLIPSGVEL
ncbi:DUF5793 family protein [Halobaculum lipolyticum]|uniref:DUF5793 family protein n=1 Tax=Halobaculum lipolyticum TaxID=3032001 RepID=A0ABD5W9C5_9EURY|nr:DUF5793 family protein [Halobaculum sp. DT31]